jgi:ectoine hydroxylase-related dioxygenase (phytanoyl-CoA dioxygenase family)
MFSAEELKFFDENGYVILKSLYNKTQVAELEAIANSLRVKAFEIAKNRPTGNEKVNKAIVNNKNFYIYNSGTKFSFKYTTPNTQPDTSELPSIARIIWAGAYEPELLNYQKHQHLTTHVAELLKSTYANHVANQIHYKIPGDGIAFDIHQDLRGLKRLNKEVWTNVNNRGSALNTITAIDEITTENGPLKVIPQSHLKGDLNLPYKSAEYFNQHHKEEYGFDAIYDAITIKMAPGDTLFMSPYLAHYSEANNSAQERKVLINEFLFPELMQYQTSGEGSGKLIRLDPNLKFSDIVFSLNAMISIANICKKLDTLAHEQTFDNYIALSMDLSHFAAIYVGRNLCFSML